MNITRASDGRANLHIWRTGKTYEHQKGAIYRQEWTNILFSVRPQPKHEHVIRYYDIRKPLPYPDNTFDAVFALHIIEHLTPSEGEKFVGQIFRVLKPGGMVRISTPDLEDIVRAYLERLEQCVQNPTKENIFKYEWSVLELVDQIVRDASGGLMIEAIKKGHFDPQYAKIRFGDVFDEFYVPQSAKQDRTPPGTSRHPFQRRLGLKPKQLYVGIIRRIKRIVINRFLNDKIVLPQDHPRVTKEANVWMYDRLSLELLLTRGGFVGFSQKDYKSSDIFNWVKYNLDQSNYGDHAIEPSIYVEAKKPSQC